MIRGLMATALILFLIIPTYACAQEKTEEQKAPPRAKTEEETPAQKFPFPFFGSPSKKKAEKLLRLNLEPKAVLKPDKSFKIEVTGRVENLSSKVFKDAKLIIGLLAINQKIDFENTEFTGQGEKELIKRKGSFERKISRIKASGVENFKVTIKTPPNSEKEGLQLAVMGVVEAKVDGKGEPARSHSIVSIKDIKSEE